MELSVRVAGMHCDSCIGKVPEALQNLAGVESVPVSLKPPMAHVIARAPIGLTEIDAALRRAGPYRAEEVMPDMQDTAAPATDGDQGSFYPLVLILAYLAGTVLVIAWTSRAFSAHTLMSWFMGGFFLVFSFFKLLDLRGFATSYQTYDLLGAAVPGCGLGVRISVRGAIARHRVRNELAADLHQCRYARADVRRRDRRPEGAGQ